MRFRAALSVSLLIIFRVGATAGECPTFSEVTASKRINPTDRVATFDGSLVAWVHELRLDTDGSRFAYDPNDHGTTALCDGMDPYVGEECLWRKGGDAGQVCSDTVKRAQAAHWERAHSPALCVYGFQAHTRDAKGNKLLWGGPFGIGPIPVQNGGQTRGFFVSQTAFPLPGNGTSRESSLYADADLIPYIVVPSAFREANGRRYMRTAALIQEAGSLHAVSAIVGDAGPALGEVSVAAAQMIHDTTLTMPHPIAAAVLAGTDTPPYPYRRRYGRVRAIDNPHDGPYLIFAFSAQFGQVQVYTKEAADQLTSGALALYGGATKLGDCARRFFDPVRYQSALMRYKTTPCGGTTALMCPLVFSVSPVHRLSVE
jgi:hypothetical protein